MEFSTFLLVVGILLFILIAVSDLFSKQLKLEKEKAEENVREEIYDSIRSAMAATIAYYPNAKIEYETLAFVKNSIQTKDGFPFNELLLKTSEIRKQLEIEHRTFFEKELANKTQLIYKKPKKSKKASKK